MTPEALDRAAGLLADLRLRAGGAVPFDDLPEECRPADLTEAYAVQDRLRQRLASVSGAPVGWKIGCTTKVMQDYLSIPHPCAGTLYANSVRRGTARVRADAYFTLGLECEIAVELARDLAPGGDAAAAVGAVMASIEIVEHRFNDFRTASVASLVADDFFSAGCVLGAPVSPAEAGDLATITGGFSVNGAVPETTGTGAAILGHPLTALGWLAEHRGGLKAGETVTLGSVVKTVYPGPGTRIEARFDRLPPAVVEVA